MFPSTPLWRRVKRQSHVILLEDQNDDFWCVATSSGMSRSVARTPKLPALRLRHFLEQSCPNQFVHFISLWRSNCSLVADDQLQMMAYLRCDFLLHR